MVNKIKIDIINSIHVKRIRELDDNFIIKNDPNNEII
jgi:uncharacterized protein YvpB